MYYDLAHPPSTFIGDYAFRTADGSNNNPDQPDMGKAGTPYARSVQQANPLPRNQLPDAGLVFDTILRRDKVCIRQLRKNSTRSLSITVPEASRWTIFSDVQFRYSRHPQCLPY